MPSMKRADVAKHNTKSDCWIIIKNKVYDVTNFLNDHPGGAGALQAFQGVDATDGFLDVGHSATADAMMADFHVGDITEAEHLAVATKADPQAEARKNYKGPSNTIPILISVAVGYIVYKLMARA